jgi:hypothetical protein
VFEPRPKEPAYAFVPDAEAPAVNRYGKSIETVPEGHELRGTLFSWPLYLLPLAAWSFKPAYLPLILLLLIPGVYISWIILVRGVREDYANYVEGFILRPGFPGRLLFPGITSHDHA